MPARKVSRGLIVCLLVYPLGAAGLVFGLSWLRAWAVDELSTPEERALWQEWKTAASKQDGTTGPVARRPPKSDEPPMLVLLRDNYAVIVVAALTFYSFLFALAVFIGRGMLRGGTP
jgi:hypothetical protein